MNNQTIEKMGTKELYEAPSTLVVEVKQEGVICASSNPLTNPDDYNNGVDPFGF